MKSCVICKEKISITSSLCRECKKIKSFVQLNSKEILLGLITSYSPIQHRKQYTFREPTAPHYNNGSLPLYPVNSET